MAKRPPAEMIAKGLSVPEGYSCFALQARRVGRRPGVESVTVQQIMIHVLIDREAAGSYVLTDQGRAVLEALMMRAATRG